MVDGASAEMSTKPATRPSENGNAADVEIALACDACTARFFHLNLPPMCIPTDARKRPASQGAHTPNSWPAASTLTIDAGRFAKVAPWMTPWKDEDDVFGRRRFRFSLKARSISAHMHASRHPVASNKRSDVGRHAETRGHCRPRCMFAARAKAPWTRPRNSMTRAKTR